MFNKDEILSSILGDNIQKEDLEPFKKFLKNLSKNFNLIKEELGPDIQEVYDSLPVDVMLAKIILKALNGIDIALKEYNADCKTTGKEYLSRKEIIALLQTGILTEMHKINFKF